MTPLLSVKHLTTTIQMDQGIVRAVKDVCFDLHQGKTLGIVGESGCGKSMLCRSILRLIPPNGTISDQSQILFNGRLISNITENELNTIRGKSIATIFQDPMSSLNPVMRIGSQITEVLVHHLQLSKGPALDRAKELLSSVGIPDPSRRIRQYPHQLSGGLRQRVAIAIALACKPKLLIADEPTTALDATVQAEILDLLDLLQTQMNMSIILVTHDLNLAASRADQIAVMYGGKIVEYALAKEIIGNPRMPYTKSLMDAVPKIENPPHTPLHFIKGMPPNLIKALSGCCFEPRCKYATKKCIEQAPMLNADNDPTHFFACWHPVETIS